MNNFDEAKRILASGNYTCVAVSAADTYTSTLRGVKPLLDLIDSGKSLKDYSVADRVVGRAAAFLYVILKADEVYADVMSKGALEVFSEYGIRAEYGELTDRIINRAKTGMCPMESAVLGIDEPFAAADAVRKKLRTLIENS